MLSTTVISFKDLEKICIWSWTFHQLAKNSDKNL